MKHIYCISGFGADERVFSRLDFCDNSVTFIQWIEPLKNEAIEHYAQRMREYIHHENPVLLGLSFGGIMCIEIAKLMSTEKVVLISSITTFHELPWWMRVSGKLHLYKISPSTSYKIFEPLQNYNLGITNKEELQLVREYRSRISRAYTKWGIRVILTWKNEWNPKHLLHIHGTRDHIFPIKIIRADYTIKGGGHFMIMNKATEINEILRTVL